MDTTEHCELSVCTDCLMMMANGSCGDDYPEGYDTEHLIDMEAHWPAADGWHLVPACPEDCEGGFSWSSCDGCGSTLGGDRHPAVAFKVAPEVQG